MIRALKPYEFLEVVETAALSFNRTNGAGVDCLCTSMVELPVAVGFLILAYDVFNPEGDTGIACDSVPAMA
jgi:hypothetical protein